MGSRLSRRGRRRFGRVDVNLTEVEASGTDVQGFKIEVEASGLGVDVIKTGVQGYGNDVDVSETDVQGNRIGVDVSRIASEGSAATEKQPGRASPACGVQPRSGAIYVAQWRKPWETGPTTA